MITPTTVILEDWVTDMGGGLRVMLVSTSFEKPEGIERAFEGYIANNNAGLVDFSIIPQGTVSEIDLPAFLAAYALDCYTQYVPPEDDPNQGRVFKSNPEEQ